MAQKSIETPAATRSTAKGQVAVVRDPRESAAMGAASGTPGARPGQPLDWLTTRLDTMLDWARGNSLWPLPFGTACCAIEFMSVVSSHYDLARFGAEVVRFSPRQSDLLIVAGTVVDKLGPVLKTIYDQMPDPKWVISMGACASSGGFYRAYHVMQGIDEIIPVDVYVPGCPPTPEGLIYGILELKKRIERGTDGSKTKTADATAK
jgi:NADH-quinone oxidoreductase subunit B